MSPPRRTYGHRKPPICEDNHPDLATHNPSDRNARRHAGGERAQTRASLSRLGLRTSSNLTAAATRERSRFTPGRVAHQLAACKIISSVPSSSDADRANLDAVLGEYHRALDAFFNGNSSRVKSLYSRGDDATLANPFGPARRGWGEVEETMDRATASYRDGRALGFDEVSRLVTLELAYLVEVEHYEAKVGGSAEATGVSLRCTTIFRREESGWKIVHRHADPITAARPAESVVRS